MQPKKEGKKKTVAGRILLKILGEKTAMRGPLAIPC